MNAIVEVKNISKKYNNKTIFSNISIEIKRGKITCIVGKNGIGKSTLIKCILGVEKIDSGEIVLNHINIQNWKREYFNNVGVQFQNASFQKTITVYDVCKEMALMYENVQNIDDLLREFGLFDFRYKRVIHLSGGQCQKLKCVLALLANPDILFFDEPTAGLDMESRMQILQKFKALSKKQHKSLIVVSHYIEEVAFLADELLIIESLNKIRKICFSENKEENYKKLRETYFNNDLL